MKKDKRRNVIPVGIFFTVFIFMLLLSSVIAVSFFYLEAKNRIAEIEKNTRNYSIPLAEAFTDVAELSYKNKDLTKLKNLFRDKINANIIDEAFLVLSDGKIVVHSNKEVEEDLKGNIATDEFAYNIDLIMLPIWTKTDHAQFMDYNIFSDNLKIPFNRDEKKLLKKYIYPKIDVSGWLITKAVYLNGKPIGCVSFIISKGRVYKFLLDHLNKSVIIFYLLTAISFCISLLISIIVYVRYRTINRIINTKEAADTDSAIIDKNNFKDKKIKEAIKIKQAAMVSKEIQTSERKIIQDAIPENENLHDNIFLEDAFAKDKEE